MKPAALIFALLSPVLLAAQSLVFNTYTPADGLADARVQKIYQDKRGVLYFLTRDGFSTFDGQRFRNYVQYHNQSLSVVSDILEENNGRITIVSISGIYFLEKNKLTKDTFSYAASVEPGSIYLTNTGEKIIAANSGVMLYRKPNAVSLKVKQEDGTTQPLMVDKALLYDNYLLALYSNPTTSHQHLLLYNWKEQKLETRIAVEGNTDIARHQDSIYLLTAQSWMKLNLDELKKGRLVTQPISFASTIPKGKRLVSFLIDFRRRTWMLTNDNQLCIADPAKGETSCYSSADGLPEGITSIFQDREGNYWFSVSGKGVYKMTQSRIGKFPFPGNNKPAPIQQYINKSPDGALSFRYNKTLGILKGASFTEKNLVSKPGVLQAFLWNDRMWTLYNNGSLENAEGATLQLVSFPTGTKSLSARIAFDKSGRLLIAGNYMVVVNPDLSFTSTELPYYADNVSCDDANNYWCLTRTGELLCFRLEQNNLLLKKRHLNNEISSRYLLHLNKDTFCIGTRSTGIIFAIANEKEYRKFGQIGTDKGISNNFVVDLQQIGHHKLLAANVAGLDLVHLDNPDTTVEQLFSRIGLFPGISSIAQVNDSIVMAISGTGEAYQVHVSAASPALTAPSFYFDQILVNGRETDTLSSRYFRYNENNFRFSVSAPSFFDEKNIRFVFHLTGTGTDFIQNSRLADFDYSNLQPGHYLLMVTAYLPGDTPVSKSITYSFTIKKPLWKTTGFLTGLIAFLLLLIYAFFQNLLRKKLLNQKIEMEKQQAVAQERSRIAVDMHDDLGAGISTIKYLSQSAPYIPPDQQKLNNLKIAEEADELVDKMNDIIWAMNEKNDTLDNLLFYAKSWIANFAQQQNLQTHFSLPSEIPSLVIRGEKRQHIFLCIKEAVHNIIKHAGALNIWFAAEISDQSLHFTIRDDGKGFETGKLYSGNGLKNMQKRMKQIGGQLELESHEGTRLHFKVPL